MRIAILQLFDPGERESYGLGLRLGDLGVEYVAVEARYLTASTNEIGVPELNIENDPELGTLPFQELGVDGIVWRISESKFTDYVNICLYLSQNYTMMNSWRCNWLCADKWRTSVELAAIGICVVPTKLIMPGQKIPTFSGTKTVIKPAVGAGGQGVRVANKDEINLSKVTCVTQPLVKGPSSAHIRVIVCGLEPIAAIHRIPNPDQLNSVIEINNVATGGSPVRADGDSLHAVSRQIASFLQSDMIGIDFVPWKDGYAVLEVNASPGFTGIKESMQIDCFEAAARQIADRMHYTGSYA